MLASPASAAGPAVKVAALNKTFQRGGKGGQVIPVNNVTFDVSDHEMVVLLGPSGCGKTTLLRCIAGLETPDSGSITIADKLVFDSGRRLALPPNRRPVSMIFQSYALWPHMSVAENIAYPLESSGVPRAQITERVTRAMDLVGLGGLRSSFPGQISGGQQQRVALARAIVGNSRVVLFDEPLSNVDAKVREGLRAEIRAMQRRLGFSGVYVTHDQAEAMAIADRIAVIDAGRVVQLAPPEVVYNAPATLYVATFVGNANLWKARVLAADQPQSVTVQTAFGILSIARSAAALPVSPGQEVTVMCRPEAVRMAPAGAANTPTAGAENTAAGGAENTVTALVRYQEFLGLHRDVTAGAEGETIRIALAGTTRVAAGQSLTLAIPPGDLRLYDASGADTDPGGWTHG